MGKLKWVIVAVAIVCVGFAICPTTPSKRQVDPRGLLEMVLEHGQSVNYRAVQVRTSLLSGKKVTSTVRVCRTDVAWLIKRNCTPLVEGEDKIADRDTWVLRLKPKNKYAPWKQLWVDKKTFVILAYRDWSNKKIKRSMKTVSISYG